MDKNEFFKRLEGRPDGVSPLSWVAGLGDEKPADASVWLMEWLRDRRPRSVEGRILGLLNAPPCPRCAGETASADEAAALAGNTLYAPARSRLCYVCGARFFPRRSVIDGPAGHWWAYSERFSGLLCKPQSKNERLDEPPPHPDTLAGDTFADHEWGESEVCADATRVALLLLLGRDPLPLVLALGGVS